MIKIAFIWKSIRATNRQPWIKMAEVKCKVWLDSDWAVLASWSVTRLTSLCPCLWCWTRRAWSSQTGRCRPAWGRTWCISPPTSRSTWGAFATTQSAPRHHKACLARLMGQEFWDEIKHGGLRCFISESGHKTVENTPCTTHMRRTSFMTG